MKFIQITDIHLTTEGGNVMGKDPGEGFRACLEHVESLHRDAELCVITGDLTHWAEPGAYRYLRDLLGIFPIPTRLLLGNHDERTAFHTVFPEAFVDTNGFVQSSEQTSAGKFIYLDTIEPRTHAGHYCADRQAWLRGELESAGEETCYLFMHHHPSPIGIAALDEIGQQQTAELRQILLEHRHHIGHIFYGHCHLPLSGTIAGIPFAALRGTSHHGWQDFTLNEPDPTLKGANLTPAYNVVMIENGDCVVHTIDYSYAGPVSEFGTAFEDWSKEDETAAVAG